MALKKKCTSVSDIIPLLYFHHSVSSGSFELGAIAGAVEDHSYLWGASSAASHRGRSIYLLRILPGA